MKQALFITLAVIAPGALLPAHASADPAFGVRTGVYVDAGDPFLGVEALARLGRSRWQLNPNVEYVFSDGVTHWTLNADAIHMFPGRRNHSLWAGGGLAVAVLDPKEGHGDGHTDLGLNLLAGAGFRGGGVTPYAQIKAILKDGSELVLAVGLRF